MSPWMPLVCDAEETKEVAFGIKSVEFKAQGFRLFPRGVGGVMLASSSVLLACDAEEAKEIALDSKLKAA